MQDLKEAPSQRPLITYQMEREIEDVFFEGTKDDTLIVDKPGVDVSRKSFLTLEGMTRIDDQIIHCYLQMIVKRSQVSSDLPKVFAMDTNFYR